MAETDPGALSSEQQERLRAWKIETQISNERYLRSHGEVDFLLSGFIREVLLRRPENIREFAAEYFTDPIVANRIWEKMREVETAK
ncbi:RIIa domain-containing protein 1 [Bombina bombina]|uniref:RIIa domain-containing protein 1 n=1 Tax=Bombina bombina TaxID=8345 RepID=UPI00235A6B3F|nr:RIIa domain-containing protein 1 [Bombina bombina]